MDSEGEKMRREEWDRRELRHDPAEAVEFEFHGYNEDESKCFSNFTTTHPFELGDKRWPSANHYFQAMKFKGTDPEYQEEIRALSDPFVASGYGKSRKHPLRSDWNTGGRDEAMKEAVTAKFSQNEEAKRVLLSTGTKRILCHNPEDGYWGHGVGCGGTNLNNLGKILEVVRDELRASDSKK